MTLYGCTVGTRLGYIIMGIEYLQAFSSICHWCCVKSGGFYYPTVLRSYLSSTWYIKVKCVLLSSTQDTLLTALSIGSSYKCIPAAKQIYKNPTIYAYSYFFVAENSCFLGNGVPSLAMTFFTLVMACALLWWRCARGIVDSVRLSWG